jgi:hypothetical protein
MHMSPKFLAAGILATMLATAASGQVVNGDFQGGYAGWSATGCAAVTGGGGNPGACGVVQYLNTGTSCTGSLSQTFNCGAVGGSCQITFDWRLDQLAGFGTAIFGMTADGGATWPFSVSGASAGWQQATVTLPCGPQTITFTQYDGTRTLQDWEFRIDNVAAVCVDPVASEPGTWSRVKALYR